MNFTKIIFGNSYNSLIINLKKMLSLLYMLKYIEGQYRIVQIKTD